MIAEIVTIGTELLLGEIVDTNAAHIARQLATIGIDHYYTTTVGDNEQRIVAALQIALARSDVVITTGGLGPTVDDVTREAVARVCGRELVFHPELLTQIEAFFCKRGTTMSPNNRRQAYLPAGAMAIENPLGTAPAFVVEIDHKVVICLPGVPHEMTWLLQERVLPYLSQRMGEGAVILCRWVHTVGIGESAIDQAISDFMHSSNPTVGTRAHPGQTDVCITAKAKTWAEALQLLEDMEQRVRQRLGSVIYGIDGETLPGVVVADLRQRKFTLALGETETGGLIARQLLQVEGGAQVVVDARIALDGLRLAKELGIQDPVLRSDAICEMANLLRQQYAADLGLVVLETDSGKSVLYVALAAPDGVHLYQWPSRGRSDVAIIWTFHLALDVVRRWLMGNRA